MMGSISTPDLATLKDKVWQDNENANVNTTERILSIAAGTFIFYKALSNIVSHPFIALQEAAVGGVLLYRGATGVCPVYSRMGKDNTDVEAITISERFIVNAPREEVYRFWRNLENLPKFMKHIASVEEKDDKTSRWTANVPGELVKVSWNAEITREEENRYIGWQSVEGSMIDNAGKVEFNDAASAGDTELYVEISYFPPAGHLGRGIASLFNGMFERMVREDVINFKHYAEGEDYKTYSSSQKQEV
jgi:uncharacterized membrane protein